MLRVRGSGFMEYIFPILSEAVCPQYYCQYLVKRWVFNPLHVKSLGSPLLASDIAESSQSFASPSTRSSHRRSRP